LGAKHTSRQKKKKGPDEEWRNKRAAGRHRARNRRSVAQEEEVVPERAMAGAATDLKAEAEKMVKKLSLEDKRKLMVAEGVWKFEPSGRPYDVRDSVDPNKIGTTALSMVPSEVHKYALQAAEKRLARNETSLVSVSRIE